MRTTGSTSTAMPTHDLYKDVHKAIPRELFEVTATAGCLDPHDPEARGAHARRVRDLFALLVAHAQHEDDHLDAWIQRILPAHAGAIAAAHVALEEEMASVLSQVDATFAVEPEQQRAATHSVYLALASFTAGYLRHQDDEERLVMPALDAALGTAALLELHQRILAGIDPETMARFLTLMLPAMNVDDRVELLAGMQETAPPEAFAGACQLAAAVLSTDDAEQLRHRLGAVGADLAANAGR